jgi:hypothetical protein
MAPATDWGAVLLSHPDSCTVCRTSQSLISCFFVKPLIGPFLLHLNQLLWDCCHNEQIVSVVCGHAVQVLKLFKCYLVPCWPSAVDGIPPCPCCAKWPQDPQCFVAYLCQRMGPVQWGVIPHALAEVDAVEFAVVVAPFVVVLLVHYAKKAGRYVIS